MNDDDKRAALLKRFGGWEQSLDPWADFKLKRTHANENNVLMRIVRKGTPWRGYGLNFEVQGVLNAVGIFDHPRSLTANALLLQPYLPAVSDNIDRIATALKNIGSAARVIGQPPYNPPYCVGFVIYRATDEFTAHWLEATEGFKEAIR